LGVARDGETCPVQFGPDRNVVWKTALPTGNSSPCLWGSHIFLTGYDKPSGRLETLCLDRASGRILWRQAVSPAKAETSIHPANGPATPTPVTDGQLVYVYFGSVGVLAYDFAGKEVWRHPLPPPQLTFASGSSPVLANHLVLLARPGKDAALLALDRRTGATVWEVKRPRFRISYATPVVRTSADGAGEVILVQRNGVVAYNPKDGSERWWVGGLFGGGIPSPALGDGLLFVVAHAPGGDPDDRIRLPNFDELLKKYDANKDGKLSEQELPKDLILYSRGQNQDPLDNITVEDLFDTIDRNRDGVLERTEWEQAGGDLQKRDSALVAIRPEGKGDLAGQIVWREKRALPEVPSPLYYRGYVYLVKDGGLVSCLDGKTGALVYRRRLGAGGHYYASLVAGGNQVYAASRDGAVVVFEVGKQGRVLARNDLGEALVATPALVDGTIYIRTAGHLYAFR
jgi:outer membrane protein assembly factor BamB